MKATMNEAYSPDQANDAERILEVYAKLPEDKKPVLMIVLNALISGMDIQERLTERLDGQTEKFPARIGMAAK